MVVKIFILGRPGSGKSTIARLLKAVAQSSGWDTRHMYDYKHLHDMFQQEIDDNLPEEERSFRQKGPQACQGFDVREGKFKVLDTVLKQMAEEVREEEQSQSGANKLLLIEFARKEYTRALDIFGYEALQGAHLLYVKLDLENCIRRVHQRAIENRSRSEYDHFVSEDIMRGYYSRDDWSDGPFSKYLNTLRIIDVTNDELDNSGTDDELESKVGKIFGKLVSLRHKAAEELLIVG
jgi:adenylate kinase family enzyme